MQDARTMNIFQPSQDLVEEILAMLVGEGLRGLDDGCQVAFHKLRNHVTIMELIRNLINDGVTYHQRFLSTLAATMCRFRSPDRDIKGGIWGKKRTFSWASNLSIFSSLNVLLVNTLCSKAFSIFLMATRSFSGSLAFLSLAATTTP